MTEFEVRKIVLDEINKQTYQAGKPNVFVHTHDGVNTPRITQDNIIPFVGIMGKINFTTNATYTLNFSSSYPTRIDLNGFAFDTGATDSSVMVVGIALLSKAYYFQPATSRSVKQSGLPYPINGVLAQCSSNLYVQDGVNPANTFPHTDQFYIMNAFDAVGSHIATAQLQNLTPTSVDIVITNLRSGWNISANFIVT